MERNLRVNLLGQGPLLMKKEFTGPRSHKVEKRCSRRWQRAFFFWGGGGGYIIAAHPPDRMSPDTKILQSQLLQHRYAT